MESGSTKKPISRNEVNTWKFLIIFLGLGIVFILLVSMRAILVGEFTPPVTFWMNVKYYLEALGAALLVAGACFSSGGLVGFLFGIPKILDPSSTDSEAAKKRTVLHNDNLVQISDWITKIIVGVGLTQLYKVAPWLKKVGLQFADSFSANPTKADQNIAIVLILYFLILGFLFAYLWTRLYFSKMLVKSVMDIDSRLSEKLDKVQKELFAKKEELVAKKEEVAAYSSSLTPFMESMRRMEGSDSENNNDPQKGQWGGKSVNNDREIIAKVTPTSDNDDLFVVSLTVQSTNPSNPLTGDVTFHLHPSFIDPIRKVPVENGIARLQVISYGAFTVGAECDNRDNKLEIDLATLHDAPPLFKER